MNDKVIEELPSDKESFWKGAEMEKIPPHEPVTCKIGDHHFTQYGQEAKCGCGVGFLLAGGTIVENGHIYQYGTLLI